MWNTKTGYSMNSYSKWKKNEFSFCFLGYPWQWVVTPKVVRTSKAQTLTPSKYSVWTVLEETPTPFAESIMCGKCIPSMCATVKKVVWMQLFFLSIHNNHTSSKTFRYYLTNTNADFADQVALNSCYHHSKFGRFWQHFYLENVNTKVSAKSGNVQVNFPEYILSCAGSYQCILHSYNFWTQSDQNFTRKMQNSSLPLDISWIWK